MDSKFVRYKVDGSVATITLDRPDKLNALYGSMRDEIVDALGTAIDDDAVRAIIVTGAGRAFCAGGDITYMEELLASGDLESFSGLVEAGGEIVRRIRATGKPVIAAVNGFAAGGGASLALACDYRIVSSAAAFSQAFVKIGMHPDWAATYLLPRIVGVARALELMSTGRAVHADEALQIGMATRVVEPDELLSEATSFADELAAGPPLALAHIKKSVLASLDVDLDAALARELDVQLELFQSSDSREGMAAFRGKRPAVYRGE